MDLKTRYLGLQLKTPVVAGSSPLGADLGALKKLEEAGVGAVVLPSIFEEQILMEGAALEKWMTHGNEQFAEATSYLPALDEFCIGVDKYADHVRKAKKAVTIPVIASLNATTAGNWTKYAREIEQAGADALELNLYHLVSDPSVVGDVVEEMDLHIVSEVCKAVKLPVAVKLSPFYSSIANMGKRMTEAGAKGLVLFNRFYQPDIDLDAIEVVPNASLSTSADLRLPLRWTAILHGRLKASLAVSSGVHGGEDAAKALLVGADCAMMCAELLRCGPGAAKKTLDVLQAWMEKHEYASVEQLKGSLSLAKCPDPEAVERAHYIKALSGYHHPAATERRH